MSFFGFKGTLTKKVAFQFLAEGFSFLTPPTARVPLPQMSQDPPLGPAEWAQGRGGAGLPSHPISAVSCRGTVLWRPSWAPSPHSQTGQPLHLLAIKPTLITCHPGQWPLDLGWMEPLGTMVGCPITRQRNRNPLGNCTKPLTPRSALSFCPPTPTLP